MNFQKIPFIENSKSMLDIAFREAREKGRAKNLSGNWLQIIRKKEILKLSIIKDSLQNKLEKIKSSLPDLKGLPAFYLQLMKLTLDYEQFKKSGSAISGAVKRIALIHGRYVQEIQLSKERTKIKILSRQFYGRISSVMKRIDNDLQILEKARRVMRTYPDIKEMFTVCIYGFPNVGKTTLLNKLTGAKANVAAYAFTTTSINAGYFIVQGKKIQVLDVPGTLAREIKMNPIELQAQLVAEELANLIIYVFDVSEQGGYSIKQQQQLLQKIEKKKVLIYLSKTDLVNKIPLLKYKVYSLPELKEKIGEEAR